MTAEQEARTPLLVQTLDFVTRLVLRRPRRTLALGLLLAGVALVLTACCLKMRTRRLDLLNPRSAYNQRWLDYLEQFGEDDDAVVVIQGPDRETVVAATDQLAKRLADESPWFQSVLHRRQLGNFRSKGLHYLDERQLAQLEQLTTQSRQLAAGDWSVATVARQWQHRAAQLEQFAAPHAPDPPRGDAARTLHLVAQQTAQLERVLRDDHSDEATQRAAWPQLVELTRLREQLSDDYLLADGGRMGIVLLRLGKDGAGFTAGSQSIDRLREILVEIQHQQADVQLGLTGLPVLENDEMRSSQSDMIRASLLSLFGVACLFVAGFGGIRYPLLTVGCLVVGIAWSFGYITLAIGHLNILSVSFGVILIGLGIDFGIHFVARYQQLRFDAPDIETAVHQTTRSVGPGIVAGAATTALAFCTAVLTDFTGVAELGLIAGGGILLCLVATLVLLPATLAIVDRNAPPVAPPLPLDRLCAPLRKLSGWVLLGTLLATLALGWGIMRLKFDHNLLHLQPENLESVKLEYRLLESTDQSVWFALSMAPDRETLRSLQAQFERLPSVQRTEEIVSLLPESGPVKQALIGRIADQLQALPAHPPALPLGDFDRLDLQLARTQNALEQLTSADDSQPTGNWQSLRPTVEALERLRGQLRLGDPEVNARRLDRWQRRRAAELLAGLQMVQAMADPRPPQSSDLPEPLSRRYLGHDGRWLLKVYARGDVWDMESLRQFVADVESVDPKVTGHPVQTYYASRQMAKSYFDAAIYSLLSVAIVLMIDFRSVRHVLLAMAPLLLATVQLMGLLGWLGIPLNPANLLVLPLILGIGIDDGVHVMHDYRDQRGVFRLSNSTAAAILLTSATTMVGFGSMMLARHRGLQSLGQVLTIGVFCCLLTSLISLPALLTSISALRRRRREPRRDGATLGTPLQSLPTSPQFPAIKRGRGRY